MIQPTYQNGLRAESMSPLSGTLGASVYSLLQVTFNSELNTGSILGNIAVFEDLYGRYAGMESIRQNPKGFARIEGKYTYKDRVVSFAPESPFKHSTKYILAIREGGVKDIYGNAFVAEQAFHFITESDDVEPRVVITAPTSGTTMNRISEIRWTNAESSAYHLELSTEKTFETIAFSDTVKAFDGSAPTLYNPSIDFQDGMYYIRVRALKGLWSEPVQIFVKRVTDAVVTSEDLSDIIHQLEIDEVPLELLQSFPPEENYETPLGLQLCYFKFKGLVPFDELDMYNSTAEKILIDGSTEIPEDVPGEWIHVYSQKEDMTYIIYKLEK